MARRKKKNYTSFEIVVIIAIAVFSIYYNYTKESSSYVIDANNIEVHFIDVGQADSMLIRCNSEAMLIDAGTNETKYELRDYIKKLKINKFKYVIGTHAHQDHIGGMDEIIKSFNIERFFMPDVAYNNKSFEEVLDELDKKNINFETPKIGDIYDICDAKFKIIYVGDDSINLNGSSIILKIIHGNNSFLMTGDTIKEIEKTLLNEDIESTVIKLAHHGSKTSNSYDFLKTVNPKYAIIEVGKDNTYNFPAKTVLNRLDKLNIKVFRTDLDGTIVVESDGNDLTFIKEK